MVPSSREHDPLSARYQRCQRDPSAAGASLHPRGRSIAFIAGDLFGHGGRVALWTAKRPEATALAKLVQEFLRYTDVLPWTEAVAPHYGTLRAALEAQGLTIAPLDLMIAAQALEADAVLVSSDKALAQIAILRLEDWSV